MEELTLSMGQSLALLAILSPLVAFLWLKEGKPFVTIEEQPAPEEVEELPTYRPLVLGQPFQRARGLN